MLVSFLGVILAEDYPKLLHCWVERVSSSSRLKTGCDCDEINYGSDEVVEEEEAAKQGNDIIMMSSADE